MRDNAMHKENTDLVDEIRNTLLINPFNKNDDYFKLLPTQID
jgi:hypothetical protein